MTVRTPERGEYGQVISCLTETRGHGYYSAEYYDADWLSNNIELFAAFDGSGELSGIAGLSKGLFNAEKTTGCLLTIRPGFTGKGTAGQLIRHFTRVLQDRGAGAVKGQAVTLHAGVQRITEKLGWIPTGFLPGARHAKDSLVLYTRNLSKDDAGTLYIHPDIKEYACNIYDRLGVKGNHHTFGHRGETMISRINDIHNRTVYIQALECGGDFAEKLPEQAIVALNLGDPSAVYGYDVLRGNGYRFCGLDPLGEYEHAILYKGKAEFDMQLTEQAEKMKREADDI